MKIEEECGINIKFPSRDKTGKGSGGEEERVGHREGVGKAKQTKKPGPSRSPHKTRARV